MRREGRLTGYTRSHCRSSKSDREQFEQHLLDLGFSGPFALADTRIKISNKPSNHSTDSRCSRTACRFCHASPPSKALSKTKGIRNKLYNRKSSRPSFSLRGRLVIDPSFFDLRDYDPLSDACDALNDEDDTFEDTIGIHHDDSDVPPDENAYEHDVNRHEHDANDDHYTHRLDARGDHYSQSCLSTSLMTQNDASDAVHFPQQQGIGGAQPVLNPIDDLVVVCNDHLPLSEALQHCGQSAPEHEGYPAVSQSFPPVDDDGSIEWCKIKSPDLESDEDDWLIC